LVTHVNEGGKESMSGCAGVEEDGGNVHVSFTVANSSNWLWGPHALPKCLYMKKENKS